MGADPTGTDGKPPQITGVRRSFVEARGVRFHVTESGPADGRPVIALHGWPQHHWAYRDLLGDPPQGLRIIAPDLPGYGWSGAAPHRWQKEDIASDVLALVDALGIDRFLLVGHDWGGYVGHLMVLRAPERIDGYLALNIAHPWQSPRTFAPHFWRFLLYQPFVASIGAALHERTSYLEKVIFRVGAPTIGRDVVRVYSERFRDPVVARAARDTYRTFLTRELPSLARHGEQRRATVPIRALFGRQDTAINPALASERTALADDYTLEISGGCHFIADERPDLVRAALIALDVETTSAS